MLTLRVAALLVIASYAFAIDNRTRRNAAPESVDDIQFDIPDIVVQYPYPTKTVTLEAFKVRNRTRTEIPKWVSVGYPTIVNNSDGQLFHFTTEYVTVYIRTLDQLQQEALVKQAKRQYPNENIQSESIIPLPLAQFACSVSIYVNETSYQLRGAVYDLRTSPSLLRFPLHRGSQKRDVFEKRIQDTNDPLFLECELAATGKQEKINTLKITAEQLQEIGLADKLLGPADEKYVVRQQLTKVSQEIRSRLHIEENYEIENEAFGEDFIQKVVDGSMSRFEPVPIDQALSQLSKYGVSYDQRDLSPSDIKRELSNILKVKKIGTKERIIAERGDSESTHSDLDINTSGKASASGLWGMASGSAEISFAMKKSNDWAKNTSSFDDQLHELNQYSKSDIKWEREGNRIIPKSLNVAKVTRMTLNQQMAFTRIKKRLSNAKFNRMYEVTTVNSVFPRDEQRLQFIATVNGPLQQLNRSVFENTQSLQRFNQALQSVQSRASNLATVVTQMRSSLWQRGPYGKSASITTVCEDLTNLSDETWGWSANRDGHIGLKSLGCQYKGPEWYLHSIYWNNLYGGSRAGKTYTNTLHASFKCCKLTLNYNRQEVLASSSESPSLWMTV